jgi:hypothetical protein
MKIPGFAQIRLLWRILRSLNRIADSLERAYPPPDKKRNFSAEVVEFDEAGSEEQDLVSVRDGKVPWDVDE